MTNVLSSILEVFESVGTWIASAVQTMIPMFYGTDGLTFLGVLAVAGLAFSVVFLIYQSIGEAMGRPIEK